jgi:2-polyprenyl-6-hydroxyphenyl methylase/3-demethylubiquinone-9 3-methyltransferase
MATYDERRFSFGRNWKNFLDHSLDPQRIELAKQKTREFLRLDSLRGRTFIDVGCGSGLFSYVAYGLEAARVYSFDSDPLSVECCQYMKAMAGNPERWTILRGSVLDGEFMKTIPSADVVYSWGVLHHTGDMWRAMRNAAGLVKPGGRFAIAIYNRLEYDTLKEWRGSYKWLRVKQLYNQSAWPMKRTLESVLALKDIVAILVRLKSPIREIRAYRENRGMSWWFDIVDWLGGYPYEFASAGEVFEFCHRELGMQLEYLKSVSQIGNHEFLFLVPEYQTPTERLDRDPQSGKR